MRATQIYYILLLLFVANQSIGQSLGFNFHTQHWDDRHGLESKQINDMAIDHNGTVWVGTKEGVYRHDGDELINLNEIVVDANIDLLVFAQELYIDSQNILWIATFFKGLYYYNISTNEVFRLTDDFFTNESILDERVYGLVELKPGVLEFTVHGKARLKYYRERDSLLAWRPFTDSIELKKHNNYQLMLIPLMNKDGKWLKNWYYGMYGLVQYLPETKTYRYINPPDKVRVGLRTAVSDSDSIIWAGEYSSGLWSYDMKTQKWNNYRCAPGENSFLNCLNVSSMNVFDENRLILNGNTDGMMLFDKRNQSFYKFKDYLPEGKWPTHTSKFRWLNGHLWMACYHSGVYCYQPAIQQFQKVYSNQYVDDAIYSPKHQGYFALLGNKSVAFYNEHGLVWVKKIKHLLANEYVLELALDSQSELWIATDGGLIKFEEDGRLFPRVLSDEDELILLENGHYIGFLIDPYDQAWLSAQNGSVIKINLKTKETELFGNKASGKNALTYSYTAKVLDVDAKDNVWFVSNGGIFFYEQQSKTFSNADSPLLLEGNDGSATAPRKLTIGNNKRAYFGSKMNEVYSLAVAPLPGQRARVEKSCLKFPAKSIKKMFTDQNGTIWMGSERGLAYFHPTNGEYGYYGEDDGVYDINNIDQIADGRLLVSGNGGFYMFHPDSLNIEPSIHHNILTSFELANTLYRYEDGQTVKTGDHIELTAKQNFINIRFNDVNYASNEKKEYAYMLKGLKDDWVKTGTRKEVNYSGLAAGDYEFLIKSKLAQNLEWSAPKLLLSISKAPAFWMTWWFWLLSLLFLAIILYAGYRYRIHQIEAKQKLIIAFNKKLAETEMTALRAQMNPHFLFNTLNAIKLNVQKNEQEEAVDFITEFSKLIRSVLQNSAKKKISLAEELEALELYIKIERKRFANKFDYHFDINSAVPLDSIKIPPLLLQPYVENAIWHGLLHKIDSNGMIDIKACRQGEQFVITIRDNGIGREKANQLKLKSANKKKSMGMQITTDRMELSNRYSEQQYSVEVKDLMDKNGRALGTEVQITIGGA